MPRVLAIALAGLFTSLAAVEGAARPHTAQQPDADHSGSATGLIVGQVLEAGGSKPIAGAIVTLTGAALRQADMPSPGAFGMPSPGVRVMTTSDGRFFFRGLRKGTYSIEATKAGYLPGRYGMRTPDGMPYMLDLDEGERVTDAIVSLWRYGTISGTVLDEAGEPVVGIPVRAFRRATVAGRRRLLPVMTMTSTDDRGSYRIATLTPGDYIVAIVSTQVAVPTSVLDEQRQLMESRPVGSPILPSTSALFEIGAPASSAGTPMTVDLGGQSLVVGRGPVPPPPSESGRLFVYPSTFYPAASSASAGGLVTVGSGEERAGIDLQLRPTRTSRVSGVVAGPDGPAAGIALRLLPSGSEEFTMPLDAAATMSGPGGAFTFVAVPQGQYTLRVLRIPRPQVGPSSMTMIQSGSGMMIGFSSSGPDPTPPPIPAEPTLWAEVPVAVGASNIEEMNIALRAGIAISGRVDFDGAAPRPTPEQLARIPIMLERADPQQTGMSIPPGRVEANGQFKTYGVNPGRYFIRAATAPSGWTFKSATYEGRDNADTPLTLEAADVSGVVVTFTDRPTELAGTVQRSEGGPDPDATVVVFPVDAQSWTGYGMNPRRMRSARTSRTGVFRFTGLPSGDYFVAAIASEAATDWQEPKYLEALSQMATQVRLEDGEKKTQDLRTRQ